jgi:FKBP-type peptidyl-prolyl cis-trans isomerase SlyD
MKIAQNSVVVMHYSVSNEEGVLIDSSFDGEPLAIIQGIGYLIPGLDNALVGHQAGDKFEVKVDAANAYGERHDTLVQTLPKAMFDGIDDLAVGAQLRASTDDGEQTVIVIDITDDTVTVDGNHPLSGMGLNFDVEIVEVREATADELAHGHVHGTGSCGHSH